MQLTRATASIILREAFCFSEKLRAGNSRSPACILPAFCNALQLFAVFFQLFFSFFVVLFSKKLHAENSGFPACILAAFCRISQLFPDFFCSFLKKKFENFSKVFKIFGELFSKLLTSFGDAII